MISFLFTVIKNENITVTHISKKVGTLMTFQKKSERLRKKVGRLRKKVRRLRKKVGSLRIGVGNGVNFRPEFRLSSTA